MLSLASSVLSPALRLSARPAACTSGLRLWQQFSGTSEESHDDFKPQFKAQPAQDAHGQITEDIKHNKVFVYMKGVPDAPQCGFSNAVCRVLDAYGVKYGSCNVLADPGIREGIKKFTSWPTIPQIFVEGEFIGGCDVLLEMHKNGELEQLVEDKKLRA